MIEEIFTCKYCNTNLTYHNKYTKSGHLSKCPDWKKWKDNFLTKERLTLLYITEGKSLPEIAKILSIESVSPIHKALKKFSIKIRSVSESFPNSDKKRKRTNIERYGSDSILYKDHPKRLQMAANLLAVHGVINVFQLESVKEKIRKTCLEKYGVVNPALNQEIKDKFNKTIFEKYGVCSPLELKNYQTNFTKPHKKVVELLIEMGFDPKTEKHIVLEGKTYFFDIWFENSSFLIEVNGDYYHANPTKYSAKEWQHPFTSKSAQEVWDYDNLKTTRANSAGFKVLTIWESELKTLLSIEKVKEKLLKFLTPAL